MHQHQPTNLNLSLSLTPQPNNTTHTSLSCLSPSPCITISLVLSPSLSLYPHPPSQLTNPAPHRSHGTNTPPRLSPSSNHQPITTTHLFLSAISPRHSSLSLFSLSTHPHRPQPLSVSHPCIPATIHHVHATAIPNHHLTSQALIATLTHRNQPTLPLRHPPTTLTNLTQPTPPSTLPSLSTPAPSLLLTAVTHLTSQFSLSITLHTLSLPTHHHLSLSPTNQPLLLLPFTQPSPLPLLLSLGSPTS